MPTPTAIDLSNQFRAKLATQEAEAAERMGRIYARIYRAALDEIAGISDYIATLDELPTTAQLARLGRVQRILRQIETQAARFGVTVENEVANIRALSLQQGADDAIALMEASLPPLPGTLGKELAGSFSRLPVDAIEQAAGLFDDQSPLAVKLQDTYGEYVRQQVESKLLDGIALGKNPRTIAMLLERNLQEALGSGLKSALTTIRTAQIKSYQLANHATYAANNNIVPEWRWWAKLDNRTCLSCLNQHGTLHPYTETLADHHGGRCAPIPETISYKALGINLPDPRPKLVSGKEWFDSQPEKTQLAMMGPGKLEAYRAGKFQFEDLSRPYQDEVYGELLREATLKELVR